MERHGNKAKKDGRKMLREEVKGKTWIEAQEDKEEAGIYIQQDYKSRQILWMMRTIRDGF